MMIWLRPWFWALFMLALPWLPIGASSLFEINYHDPARCTLGPTCDFLRH